MGFAAIAIVLIAIGAIVRSLPSDGGKVPTKLAGYVIMFVGVGLTFLNAVVMIRVGEVGVKHFLGSVDPASSRTGLARRQSLRLRGTDVDPRAVLPGPGRRGADRGPDLGAAQRRA